MKLLLSVLLYLVMKVCGDDDSGWSLADNPLVATHPCKGSTDIQVTYEPGRSPEEENQYNLWIHKKFPKNTIIKLKFDKGATVTLSNESVARIDLDKSDDNTFRIRFFKSHEGICFHVQGCSLGVVPYIKSVNINTKEYCGEPMMGFWTLTSKATKKQAQSSCLKVSEVLKGSCGRRQTVAVPLSVDGQAQLGDWPWHVALYKEGVSKFLRYECGGTLISNYHVLTAAHCVLKRNVPLQPEKLSLMLGNNKLFHNAEPEGVVKEVEKVIIHEHFDSVTFNNDIALLKSKSEITFTLYIQPACLWYENAEQKFESQTILGIIVGWGYGDDNILSSTLNQAQIPIVSDITCLRNNPAFYSRFLTKEKFCAGHLGEAVACNGDSGGGFHVFIPDKGNDNSTNGAWHIRGIVSSSVAKTDGTCSGDHYTLFTDIDKYREWIIGHM